MVSLAPFVVLCILATALLSADGRRLQDYEGNLAASNCTDMPPPGGKSCEEHRAAGDCNSPVTASRNFCAASCGRCTLKAPPHGQEAPTPAQEPPSPAQENSLPATASLAPSAKGQQAPSTSPAPAAEPAGSTPASAVPGPEQEPSLALTQPTNPAAATAAGAATPMQQSGPGPAAEAAAPGAATRRGSTLTPTPEPGLESATSGGAPTPAPEAAARGSSSAAAAPPPAPEAAGGGSSTTASAAAGNATAATASPAGSVAIFKGDGTAYSEKVPNTGRGFACSYRYLNDWASTHFAAINVHQWDGGNSCGRCVAVRCVDSRCKTQDKDVVVMLVDQCPECQFGDLDFSIPAYREITGMWPHRLQVQWQWADCSSYINGTIRMAPKDGGNQFWQAFYFSNMKYPLTKVKLNGMELARSEYQFFQHPAPLGDGPHEFEFHAENGAVVTAAIKDPLKEQDLGVQFDEIK